MATDLGFLELVYLRFVDPDFMNMFSWSIYRPSHLQLKLTCNHTTKHQEKRSEVVSTGGEALRSSPHLKK